MTYSPQINKTNSLSDDLTVKYLKKRLKNLNRLVRTEEAAPADYINRDRVAFQLRELQRARRITLFNPIPVTI